MKSLFYQRELIREYILVFLSSVWDVCRSYAQHTDTNLDTFAFTPRFDNASLEARRSQLVLIDEHHQACLSDFRY